ncbi:hypothetical protein GFS31_03150 [Leptolyngbya sp. BL0902]|uniref:hypothetical protein n=1 Tax=Leptolyngbya sp. BL0902 TaxID=1115757 RepID=UPI0018E6EABE|nr:hypothetical protein [Leptolyngbya sp. BL0902]QQE63647.1 hypothetical protein GFS31_03150 [Leptolyngbya sp. BL0902]
MFPELVVGPLFRNRVWGQFAPFRGVISSVVSSLPWAMGAAGLFLVGCGGVAESMDRGVELDPMAVAASPATANPSAAERWYLAVSEANRAAHLAQSASTAADWQQVATSWGQSALWLKGMPVEDPRYAFSQRRAQEYLNNRAVAQDQAAQAQPDGMPRVFPPLGSAVLDEQLSLYHSYVATLGPPDVLIIGSSRALQGIDPQVLQQALAAQGRPNLRVYNFSVNGATAQVMSFVTRQLLAEDMHPRLVIWAEGARGFNSGRFDRTFASILESPGFAAVRDGARLSLVDPSPNLAIPDGPVPMTAINSQGFLAVNDQFNPEVYYRSFPRVRGQYDDTYRAFRLDGVQTLSLEAVIQSFRSRGIPLVFVNLPLSNDYLDPVRMGYERQFQRFLQTYANRGTMTVIDLLELWRWQSHFFADPSHINRYGAREIARLLAEDSRIAWPTVPKAVPVAETNAP